MNKLIVIAILLLTFSCNRKNKFEREEYLFKYLTEVQTVNLKQNNNYMVFIINNNTCNCTGDPGVIISSNFSKNNKLKYIIVGKNDTTLISNLKLKIKKIEILIDKDNELALYGLGNATNYLFEVNNNEIVYWNYMSNTTVKEIAEKYLQNK
jgi:hypothetical protein